MTIPRIKLPIPLRRTIVKRLNCREVSELISRRHEQPLTTGEKFWLRMHLYLCNGCRNFQHNMQVMRAAMQRYLDQGNDR